MPSFDILDRTMRECSEEPWTCFWTAGQRIDPSRESTFVWVTSNTTVSRMTYTNWRSGEPNYLVSNESCMSVVLPSRYWYDNVCSRAFCFVCEL